MIDQRIVEEIVRRVLERLAADPRFRGLLSANPTPADGRNGVVPGIASTGGSAGGGMAVASGRRHFDRLLSEWDVLQVHRSGGRMIVLSAKTIVTPLARERARDLGVELVFE